MVAGIELAICSLLVNFPSVVAVAYLPPLSLAPSPSATFLLSLNFTKCVHSAAAVVYGYLQADIPKM